MDTLSPSERSRLMARVHGKDTQPERRVRTIAHALGLRFRLHRRDLKGRPDLVFPKHKVALFVHGCFWHQHPGCKRASMPDNRREFWLAKLTRNVERDFEVGSQLRSEGWRVEIIWECETKDPARLRKHLQKVFYGPFVKKRKRARPA
ncbi:very short patch repair endonuclease [Bradyrhizobium sp.]